MNVWQIIASVGGGIGAFVGVVSLILTIMGRVKMSGVMETRLVKLEDWQRDKSVDRLEFVDLTKRVDCAEADAVKASDGVNELRVQFAAIPGELRSIRDLMERDGRDTRHDISGLRMGMEKLADLIRSGPRQ